MESVPFPNRRFEKSRRWEPRSLGIRISLLSFHLGNDSTSDFMVLKSLLSHLLTFPIARMNSSLDLLDSRAVGLSQARVPLTRVAREIWELYPIKETKVFFFLATSHRMHKPHMTRQKVTCSGKLIRHDYSVTLGIASLSGDFPISYSSFCLRTALPLLGGFQGRVLMASTIITASHLSLPIVGA